MAEVWISVTPMDKSHEREIRVTRHTVYYELHDMVRTLFPNFYKEYDRLGLYTSCGTKISLSSSKQVDLKVFRTANFLYVLDVENFVDNVKLQKQLFAGE